MSQKRPDLDNDAMSVWRLVKWLLNNVSSDVFISGSRSCDKQRLDSDWDFIVAVQRTTIAPRPREVFGVHADVACVVDPPDRLTPESLRIRSLEDLEKFEGRTRHG